LRTDKFSAAQKVLRIVGNPEDHYCVRNSTQLNPVLCQINQFLTLPSHFFKTNFNIIFPPASSLPSRLSPSGFPTTIPH